MSEVVVRLGHHTVAIELPEHLLSDGILASLKSDVPQAGVDERIIVSMASDRSYALQGGHGPEEEDGLKRGALLERLLARLAGTFARKAQVPVLRAAAVGWADGAVLIAGPEASGKSSLAAWFIETGFALIGDDQVAITDALGTVSGYPAPLAFAAGDADHLIALTDFASAPMARTAERIHVGVREAWRADGDALACRMMIFPHFARDAQPRLEKLETVAAARLLKAQLTSPAGGEADYWTIQMARSIPAIALTYSHYDQINGLLDRLVKLVIDERLSPVDFDRFVSGIGRPASTAARKYPVPERSTRRFSPFLTIGMATYDDYDGVYFSLQAIRLYHPEIVDEVEFLIIDNHPDGPCAAALKDLEKHIPNLRYIPAADVTGTAVRDRVFSEAGGEFVLCMDCHVLFAPASLRKLIDYFRSVPESGDLIQGPLIYDDLATISTHWLEGWREGMFGYWYKNPAGAESDGQPFEITFQGLGIFACRRAAWPGFNPAFRGFGGEEGYIQERFRRAGHRVLCLPALRWVHRFGRPMGQTYPNRWEDRIRNYLIGFGEIGWDTTEMQQHFRERLGQQTADRIFAAIRKELAAGGEGQELDPVRLDDFRDDEPYDLGEARLRFVAETVVPVLLGKFAFDTVTCLGRGADIWLREFARHGIVSPPEMPDPSRSLVCCFEPGDISTVVAAEHCVGRLTAMAPVVVFTFARPPGDDAIDYNRIRASWTALFARRGYKPIDCLRPALAHDPRADSHYQQNLIVFSRSGVAAGAQRAPAILSRTAGTNVSVIIPVYNGAAFLGQAIESILLQTHSQFELIVVNDGSTDTTGAIADSYATADKRIRVIHQRNGGEAAAFNAGAAAARFALLARVDHDDVALPERLALQVAFLEKHEDVAAVGGTMRCIDRQGKLTGTRATYPLTPEACHAALVNATAGPIGNPAAMIRKAAFERCGGLRVQFRTSSDFDLWLRLDEQFKLANLPDVLVDYRMHGANLTAKGRFAQALNAHIAKQAALLRRRGEADPVNNWTKLGLETLAVFPMLEEDKARAYSELFEAALTNFTTTNDTVFLALADKCLSLIPDGYDLT